MYDGFAWQTSLEQMFPLPNGFALAALPSCIDQKDLDFDFFHYRAGIIRSHAGLDFEVAFEDTDIEDDDNADARVVSTVSCTSGTGD